MVSSGSEQNKVDQKYRINLQGSRTFIIEYNDSSKGQRVVPTWDTPSGVLSGSRTKRRNTCGHIPLHDEFLNKYRNAMACLWNRTFATPSLLDNDFVKRYTGI